MTQAKDDETAIDREYLSKALGAADFARMNAGTLSNRELAAIVDAAKRTHHTLAALEQIASYEISDNLNYYNARRMIEIAREAVQNHDRKM